ncbi:hypothetical protein [Streptomyces alkaliterrae]|uniref:Uncharacterized protein n=1 Tax=Streptomyces alkaliterrae TaxID=2213162 RepID=A0A5P0YPA9_9ACTN|nr:hypothetical protein [Streptomyces alkaliterrae]MBB1260169.1 hypothetical protein [Streptomyces alkaliterrae]MQS02088.1 hypothetical protein [Streptomyces alkaliterrae]
MEIHERLALVYQRLRDLPPARTAEEALHQLDTTLTKVEDEHSGVPFNPNAGLASDGRMYFPREDFTTRHPDGSVTALTKGQVITAQPNGELTITSRRTGEVVYHRPGAK